MKPPAVPFERYDSSVLRVAEDIASVAKGTLDPGGESETYAQWAKWLRWRVEDTWETSGGFDWEYDDAVREVCRAALELHDRRKREMRL